MRVLFPPGRTAQFSPKPSTALQERNRNIRSIRELGRREWYMRSGYSKRSMVENTVYRYKTIVGPMLADLVRHETSRQLCVIDD